MAKNKGAMSRHHRAKLFSCGVTACGLKNVVKSGNFYTANIFAQIAVDPGFSVMVMGQVVGTAMPAVQLTPVSSGSTMYQSPTISFPGTTGQTVSVSVIAHFQADLTCQGTFGPLP